MRYANLCSQLQNVIPALEGTPFKVHTVKPEALYITHNPQDIPFDERIDLQVSVNDMLVTIQLYEEDNPSPIYGSHHRLNLQHWSIEEVFTLRTKVILAQIGAMSS